ncbi:hypothetical protein RIF29_37852 [Crotalaria pallida]|uniref:Uncharacterized protein n=1 Tax=Crotalaria pallida TaxID=3830 RepID=A0AAN9E154_CROPI
MKENVSLAFYQNKDYENLKSLIHTSNAAATLLFSKVPNILFSSLWFAAAPSNAAAAPPNGDAAAAPSNSDAAAAPSNSNAAAAFSFPPFDLPCCGSHSNPHTIHLLR